MAAKAPWKTLLARDRLYCVICFHNAQEQQAREGAWSAEEGKRRSWVRIIEPTPELNPVNPRTRAAFTAKQKAAFRRHVAECHPEWTDRINWSRAL